MSQRGGLSKGPERLAAAAVFRLGASSWRPASRPTQPRRFVILRVYG